MQTRKEIEEKLTVSDDPEVQHGSAGGHLTYSSLAPLPLI